MDKRIIIIAILVVVALVLTVVRESKQTEHEKVSPVSASEKKVVSGDRVMSMADTTLHLLGIKKENIRPVRNRNDVRVSYPRTFEVLKFVAAIQDSLDGTTASVFSTENARENVSIVQIKSGDVILKSFIFSKEIQKGVAPSVKKQTKRH